MASISEPFVKRPVMTLLCAVSALLFGIWSYTQLPVSDLPDVDYPVIQVQANYPGASPQIMAANVGFATGAAVPPDQRAGDRDVLQYAG